MEQISAELAEEIGGVEFQRFTCKQNISICPFCSRVLNWTRKSNTGAHKVCKICSCVFFVPGHLMEV
jgi:hypothetical protein